MYEKYTKLPDYSEWTKKKTVYKCMTDIKCENGMFTTGSYVMLNVCSAEEGEIYVIDFISVCKKVKEDFNIINYTNDISETVEYDTISLLPNQLSNYFEEVKELNQKIKAIENSEIISIFLVLLFFAIPIFLSFIFKNPDIGLFAVIVLIIGLILRGIVIHKIKDRFIRSIKEKTMCHGDTPTKE